MDKGFFRRENFGSASWPMDKGSFRRENFGSVSSPMDKGSFRRENLGSASWPMYKGSFRREKSLVLSRGLWTKVLSVGKNIWFCLVAYGQRLFL